MNRYQFEVLTYIEKNGKKDYPMRTLSDTLKISEQLYPRHLMS